MSDPVTTGPRRSRLLTSAANVIGFAHLQGLAPAATNAAVERTEPTLPAPAGKKDGEADRHPDGKFKKTDDGDDGKDDDEEGDDESDDSDTASAAAPRIRCARLRERARCAAIMGAPEAAKNVQLAAHLAFETNLSRSAAVEALKKGESKGGLASRMARHPDPGVGGGAERPAGVSQAAVASSWDAAFKKTRR